MLVIVGQKSHPSLLFPRSPPQVCDHPPSLCSPTKEPFSPLSNVVSTEPFRGCYVQAQPCDEFTSSNRRYLPPQVCRKLRPVGPELPE